MVDNWKCETRGCSSQIYIEGPTSTTKTIIAHVFDGGKVDNAAFIIRACNSHAELVEALEKSIAVLKDGFDPSGCSNSDEALAILVKALAKAKGE